MYSSEIRDLSKYRLERAKQDLKDAQKTLELEMYSVAANRSYYAIFHAARSVLALKMTDYKKHSGVISGFRKDFIKTGIFDKKMSAIIKNAFDLRSETDYEDFYIIPKEDVIAQVKEAEYFINNIENYLARELEL